MTSVHQRLLPCRHHRFCFSDQTTDYTIGKKSLRSAFLWNIVFIGPSTRLHAPPKSRRHWHAPSRVANTAHAPSRASSFCHAPACARVPLLTSALGDVICHVIAMSSIDVICHDICWRHLPWHPLTSSATAPTDVIVDQTVDFDRWLFLRVDFFSPSSSYPVFRVDFIFAVCFCILCL